MKRFVTFFAFTFSIVLNAQEINIIPQPVKIRPGKGYFEIDQNIEIIYNRRTEFPAKFLKNYLKENMGIDCRLVTKSENITNIQIINAITETKGYYELLINNRGVLITADSAGVFYGIQTLIQLLPTQNLKSKSKNPTLSIPQLEIIDYPRFEYRGIHLDVGRHFFPVSFIKKYIDYLALHKFNIFHWHLTEDQGWRIEVKKYPELTKVGGWRNGTIIGRYPGTGNDNIRYGGFYTQEEIKEVVQYAKERFIEVIPEIEMPGHSSAAIAAYPWLSCFPERPTAIPAKMISKESALRQAQGDIKLVQETWGVFDDIFCAGNDSVFVFLQNVIDEVIPLFPSKYFHIGGDEAPKTHWKQCPRCQKRIKELGLKDEHELQSYFVQRIEKYLNSKGKTLIGWDEILEGGLAPNAVVMSWRGEQGGIDAAKQNHDVIMTPGNPVYFDHTQSENEDSVTIGGFNPIEKVYAYEPIPKELNEEQAKHVLGAQANLWTEYIGNERKVEYMLFPRISALSEVLWSPKENRDPIAIGWKDFEKRLMGQFKRYDMWNVNYSKAYFDLKARIIQTENNIGVLWKLESKNKGDMIRTSHWIKGNKLGPLKTQDLELLGYYNNHILVTSSSTLAAILLTNSGKSIVPIGDTLKQNFFFNKATGKKITLTNPASDKYPGDGAFTLVNGVINEKGFAKTREFLGFNGTDCEAVIDLGSSQLISFVVVNALNRTSSWIWRPLTAEVFGSGDGQTWYSLKLTDDFEENKNGTGKGMMTMSFKATYAQYVKVVIKNWGIIPEGNPGAGNKAWLFVDEIEVDGPSEAELKRNN